MDRPSHGTMMPCVMIRGRKARDRLGPAFIPDAFFASFGPDTAGVERDYRGEYHVTTFADLGRRKRQRQAEILYWRRHSLMTERRPLYVWVFHCPGIGVAYRGWWTYLIGRGIEEGRWLHRDEEMQRRLMQLFPLVEPTFDGVYADFRRWEPLFARTYCVRNPDGTPHRHAGRIQGKAFVWAAVSGDRVERILERIEINNQREHGEHGERA